MNARNLDRRAVIPAIATIGLISVAIAASIPAITQLQAQVRNSAPDNYAVSVDIVKLTDGMAWFYVNQSEPRQVCVNILQDEEISWGALFCTSERTFVTTADIATTIGDRYSARVDLYDAAGRFYASKNVAVVVR